MIRLDLVRELSQKNNTTIKEAELFLDSFIQIITETMAKGEKVQLAGFGTWEVREYSSRTGRNPKTGEKLDISAFNYPAFKAGKHLKEKVAGAKIPVTLVNPDNNEEQKPAKNGTKSKTTKSRSSQNTNSRANTASPPLPPADTKVSPA
jgi:DNA-binding protein HU-beta